jgi:hypothetical protein
VVARLVLFVLRARSARRGVPHLLGGGGATLATPSV